jgi:hypothetical protein
MSPPNAPADTAQSDGASFHAFNINIDLYQERAFSVRWIDRFGPLLARALTEIAI